MVGSAVWRALQNKGYTNLLGKTSTELDLRNQQAVADFYKKEQPEVVIDAAAKVGGIHANNTYPANFIYENIMIQNHKKVDKSKELNKINTSREPHRVCKTGSLVAPAER